MPRQYKIKNYSFWKEKKIHPQKKDIPETKPLDQSPLNPVFKKPQEKQEKSWCIIM